MDTSYYSCDKYICLLCYDLRSWQMLVEEKNYWLGIHVVYGILRAEWSRVKMEIFLVLWQL